MKSRALIIIVNLISFVMKVFFQLTSMQFDANQHSVAYIFVLLIQTLHILA